MKKIIAVITICLSTGIVGLNAQNMYDANKLMGTDLTGTARFVGMGGAMSALGSDISTMGTNPAGIGIYRSNDAMVSFGFVNAGSKSTFEDKVSDTDNLFGSFDNIGFVFSNKIGDLTALKYVNFGFNYRQLKSFNKNLATSGVFSVSQTQQFANIVNANSESYGGFLSPEVLMDRNAFEYPDVPWLGAMAYEANLIVPEGEEYLPYLFDDNLVAGKYNSKERGRLDGADINIAFNFYDRLYIGASLGAYSLDYTRNTSYSEDFYVPNYGAKNEYDGSYTLNNDYFLEGSGIDFKLGFILRPVETSSFRIGASIHTPTWYQLKERHFAWLDYDTYNVDKEKFLTGKTYPQNGDGIDMEGETEYRLTTPWKYNLSLGYTIGRNIALGAEYEYSDYSTAKLRYDNGLMMRDETDMMKTYMKGVHTIRAGAEIRLNPSFSFRMGYNHITPSISSDAYKEISVNAIRTDTEFSNGKKINNYTLGLGYRADTFYADMTYLYNTYKEDFFAFDNLDLPATKVVNNNRKIAFTIGVRF
ncbi:hypothetical protein EZS27_000778 [termite gut metagenome]|uniref:Hemin receptor n=1 Tax=termite gut metagenome TaxID=433724 RepID=A0A5J4T066_9ZZZZ